MRQAFLFVLALIDARALASNCAESGGAGAEG